MIRAEVLIDGWTDPFDDIGSACSALEGEDLADAGFRAVTAACPEVPLLMFNGTIVRIGQRFDISPVRVPTSRAFTTRRPPVELVDVLCPGDDFARTDLQVVAY